MTDQGLRDPNQEQRTTTVETTTTGPGNSEYARPGRVEGLVIAGLAIFRREPA